jgi:DNA-binding beta-propeller fold protein YncE
VKRNYLTICALAFALPGYAFADWNITKEIPIGGDGGWDYLAMEPSGHRLFVTHMNQVVVLDVRTDKLVGSIASAKAHGFAFSPELNRGFISNGASNSVAIFNLRSLKIIQTVQVGQGPDAICYEPITKRVLAFNGRGRSVSFIDAATGKVLGETPLPGDPEFAQADGAGFVFDNIEDKGLVLKIDAAKMTVVATWLLPPGSAPSAMAIDRADHRLFSGCAGRKLYVLNSDSGEILACGDGTLSVIKQESANTFSVEEQAPTQKGARTVAFDSATQTAYLPIATFGVTPPATADNPHPRPAIMPGSLKLLVVTHG